MIYVTVGSADCAGIRFDRLVREMDRIAGGLNEEVLIQHGTVQYNFRHARHVDYVPFDRARQLIRDARLVVGHCGAGTIINGMTFRTPMVLVPRRFEAGELDADDHQMQLAAQLENSPGIRIVYDIDRLEEAVREMLGDESQAVETSPERRSMMNALAAFLGG